MSDWITDLLGAADLLRGGDIAGAESLLRGVLATEPDQASALFMLGSAALSDGRPAEAAALLGRVVGLQPGHREARLAAARAFLAVGQPQAAVDVLGPLAAEPALFAALLLLGTALSALQRPADAVAALGHAVAARPDHAEAQLNLGNALAAADDPAASEHHIRTALRLDPCLPEAHVSLGHLLTEAGRLEEAVAACEQAIALRPNLAAAHWNAGVAHLLAGDFAAGWERYEWRKRHFPGAFAAPPGPQWTGGSVAGRTVLVVAEQGLGDAIQFSRFLPLLTGRGAAVLLECAPALAPLLRQLPGVTVLPRGTARPRYDLWVDQMSLPRLFGTEPGAIPASSGYLTAQPDRVAEWDRVLPAGFRVGVVCCGNRLHSNDRRRSMPLSALAPVVAASPRGVVSLQVGPRAGDLARLFGVADLSTRLPDFAETAAVVGALDLVITVDTAVAHLAGAMGVPVWVMLPYAPDWRWMLHRADSPWYDSMRLYRQSAPGDWPGVASRVAAALAATARRPYSIAMPPLTCSVAPVTHAASLDAR